MSSRICFPLVAAALAALAAPLSAHAARTAFRITDMDLRDPHTYLSFIGCVDVTDNQLLGFSMNSQLQTALQTDGDFDGNLDLSYLIIFDPLDQGAGGGTLEFTYADCVAPVPPSLCVETVPSVTASNTNMGTTCLEPIIGTMYGPYTPEITSAAAPCFVAFLGEVSLTLAGAPLWLSDTYLAATYVGAPATSLSNGLIRGFLSEETANNTILPASLPIVGGEPLSILFPGGDPPGTGINCASHSDKDIGPGGVTGWYMYFNFTAAPVQIPTGVGDAPRPSLVLDLPHPNPFNPSTSIRYTLPAPSRVQLSIHDAGGRTVARLVDSDQAGGTHAVTWNGRDASGETASSGVYFVRLLSGAQSRTQKIVLLK